MDLVSNTYGGGGLLIKQELSPSMHVAVNIAIDEVGRDRIYNYRSVLVGVWVFTSMCHSSVVSSCVVAAIAPQHLQSAPVRSTVHTVAITDSNPVA